MQIIITDVRWLQGYIKSVVRAVPIAVLRPLIGVSEAFVSTITGARNAIDPELKRDLKQKYKE